METFVSPKSEGTNRAFRCAVCQGNNAKIAYEGPIRLGRFGNLSQQHYSLMQCLSCQAIALPSLFEDQTAFYESSDYRVAVDGNSESEHFYHLHDEEQIRNLSVLGTSMWRNKIIADVGCGAGSFLDAVHGFAKQIVAIEPSQIFQKILREKNFSVYSYADAALNDLSAGVDIACSFSVIEHIQDPLRFLQDIHALLVPSGQLVLSTPNARDILLELLPEEYGSFFYRQVHLWYFSADALTNLLQLAGFDDIQIVPFQRFGLGNFLSWLQHKRPMGNIEMNFISKTLDQVWKSELETSGRCDYLYAIARKRSSS
jgi:2-polyprenyl-3-methyl-5-hydroxy-6-metoxy-1,4-benzoquinol methylase